MILDSSVFKFVSLWKTSWLYCLLRIALPFFLMGFKFQTLWGYIVVKCTKTFINPTLGKFTMQIGNEMWSKLKLTETLT